MDARLVVGVSGASGAPLALRLLLLAQECGLGVELIVTPGGARTLREECGLGPEDLAQYAEAYMTVRTSPRRRPRAAIRRWAWRWCRAA